MEEREFQREKVNRYYGLGEYERNTETGNKGKMKALEMK
jgi:hypothetical protein